MIMFDLIASALVLAATGYTIYHIGRTLTRGEKQSSHCDDCSVKQMMTTSPRDHRSASMNS
jgi:hypothetical protein